MRINKLSKCLALVLSMIMLCSVCIPSVAAVDEPTVTVASVEADPGETVEVTVSLANNPGIVNFYVPLYYDDNNLELTEITNNTSLTFTKPGKYESPCNLYVYTTATENDETNGDWFTLTFKVKENAVRGTICPVTLDTDYEIYDVDFDDVDFEIENGGITVKQAAAPAPEVVQMDVDDYKGDTATQEVPESATNGKVFAGWFEDEDCQIPYTGTSGQAYAKFVDDDVHQSLGQIATGTTANSATTDIRFATMVDSLDYQKVGFEITLNSKTATTESRTAHTLLQGGDKTYEPSEYSNQASYFVTFVLKNIPNEVFNDTFSIRSYWITLDGTKVYGEVKNFEIINKL